MGQLLYYYQFLLFDVLSSGKTYKKDASRMVGGEASCWYIIRVCVLLSVSQENEEFSFGFNPYACACAFVECSLPPVSEIVYGV